MPAIRPSSRFTLLFFLFILASVLVFFPFYSSLFFVVMFLFKASDDDLTPAYLYLTELDVNFAQEIFTLPTESSYSAVTNWKYSLNDTALPATPSATLLQNNLDHWMIYLDVQYQDFNFASISAAISDLHHLLNTYHVELSPDDSTAATLAITQIPIYDYLTSPSSSLPPSTAERFDIFRQVGIYTSLKRFTNPYLSTTPVWTISSRFGYRFHPLTATPQKHLGIDIPMPEGTPIHAVYPGKVTIPPADPDGYGIHLKITHAKHTFLYAHLSGLNVTNGQQVAQKDIIGYTGNTGDSTGSHLHLEYHYDPTLFPGDTKILNPQFYVDGDPTSSPSATPSP